MIILWQVHCFGKDGIPTRGVLTTIWEVQLKKQGLSVLLVILYEVDFACTPPAFVPSLLLLLTCMQRVNMDTSLPVCSLIVDSCYGGSSMEERNTMPDPLQPTTGS